MRVLPGILVAAALTSVAGCDATQPPVLETPRPVLPAVPADLMRPVPLPRPHPGEDARGFAAKALVAGAAANRKVEDWNAFYRDAAQRFGAGD